MVKFKNPLEWIKYKLYIKMMDWCKTYCWFWAMLHWFSPYEMWLDPLFAGHLRHNHSYHLLFHYLGKYLAASISYYTLPSNFPFLQISMLSIPSVVLCSYHDNRWLHFYQQTIFDIPRLLQRPSCVLYPNSCRIHLF